MCVPWSEYWDFLETSIDLDSEEGLQKLEDHLSHKRDAILAEISQKRQAEIETRNDLDICNLLERLRLSDSGGLLLNCSVEGKSAVRKKPQTGNHLQIHAQKTKDEENNARGDSSLLKDDDQVQTSHSRTNDLRVDELVGEAERSDDGEACWAAAANAAAEVENDDWDAASFHTAVDDLDLEYSECSDVLDETWEAHLPQPVTVFLMG